MEELIKEIMEWHKKTFPDITQDEQSQKIQIEWAEWLLTGILKEKVEEYADLYIASIGMLRFSKDDDLAYKTRNKGNNFYGEAFHKAVRDKFEILKNSEWHRVDGKEWKRVKTE